MLVTALALFFSRTRIGRALRAVADDHQAALAVGIPLQQIWAIVWGVAGAVALVAGLLWGARNGVQFALTFVALKALPVLILGGFESIPGAIVGGLIIGATEKLAEVYLGPFVGGGIEGWFPYVLALLFLLVRPEGLFGEKIIRPHLTMLYREAGQFKTSYEKDAAIFPIRQDRIAIALILVVAFVVVPLAATPYLLHRHPDPVPDPRRSRRSASTSSRATQASFRSARRRSWRSARSRRTTSCCACPACRSCRIRAWRRRRGARRHPVRPAEPAHPRLLPRRRHARRAVLHRVVPDQGRLDHQLQRARA